MHSTIAYEEGELGEGAGGGSKGFGEGRSLDGNPDATVRALLDDDDVDDELDAADAGFVGVEGGEDTTQSSAGEEAVTPTLAERGVRPDSPAGGITNKRAEGGREARGHLEATNESQSQESSRWQGRPRHTQPCSTAGGSTSHRAGQGFVEASEGRSGGSTAVGGCNGGAFGPQHVDDDFSNGSSTELTLGRPDPASVHWKFSRRLLQT